MTNRLTALGAVLAVTLLGAGLLANAAGAKPRAETQVTARFNDGDALVGRVKTAEPCRPGRRILLIRDDPMTGRVVERRTRTNDSGRYSFGRNMYEIGSDYFVKAETRKRSRVICGSAQTQVPLF